MYPFFHVYNYELCRKPTTPRGVPFVTMPHIMTCYSLMMTTAALDNLVNFGLKANTETLRVSDFLMAGNSVRLETKLKAQSWNLSLSALIVIISTAVAYPAEIKWRRYLVSVDNSSRDAKVREVWNR